jgi:hypothetical protein
LAVKTEAYYMGAYAFVKRKIAKFNTFFVLNICMIVTMPMPNGGGRFSRPVQNRHTKTATSTPKNFIFLTTGIVLHVHTLQGIIKSAFAKMHHAQETARDESLRILIIRNGGTRKPPNFPEGCKETLT